MRTVRGEVRCLGKRFLETVLPRRMMSILRKQSHEPELELLPRLCDPNRVALDVGANDGVYSLDLIPLARRVIAFEPNPKLSRWLKRVFKTTVDVEDVALSDTAGRAVIRIPRYRYGHATMSEENTLSQLVARDDIQSVEVTTKRLDDYQMTDVGFIKVDVEGFETAVLRGAIETIRANKPNLLVEVEERHHKGSVAAVAKILGELGYQGFFYREGALQPMARFCLATHQVVENVGCHERYVNNFVFMPRP